VADLARVLPGLPRQPEGWRYPDNDLPAAINVEVRTPAMGAWVDSGLVEHEPETGLLWVHGHIERQLGAMTDSNPTKWLPSTCARLDRLPETPLIARFRQHYLVCPRYFAPSGDAIEQALATVAVRAGDYANDQLSKAMRGKAIIGDVVGMWQRRGENRQTICFAVDKAHAHDLAAEFTSAGIAAEVVIDTTDDGERERIFGAFDKLDVRVLVSVGVLAIGFDSPVASCAILARPIRVTPSLSSMSWPPTAATT
jgi:hypothetical protein